MPSVALTDDEIIARCHSGALLDDIDRFDIDGNDASFLHRCVSLHNAGEIDLLAMTQTVQFHLLSGPDFFVRQQFFCEVIPQLESPVPPLMQAVRALVAKGGADYLANRPNEAFRDWCASDLPARAGAIVAAAEAGDVQAIAFVTFAFMALGDAALVRSFAGTYSDERRLSALCALGRIKPADAKDAEESIGVLMPFVDAAYDETTRCNALMPLLEICKHFPDLALAYLPKAIVAATVAPTPDLLFNLAQALSFHAKLFDRASIKCALGALKATDQALGGIVHVLDGALTTMLATLTAI